VLYHPEAIILAVEPVDTLHAIRRSIDSATSMVIGGEADEGATARWVPHMTVGYSTASQPADPIIAALGTSIPARRLVVEAVTLVVQWGRNVSGAGSQSELYDSPQRRAVSSRPSVSGVEQLPQRDRSGGCADFSIRDGGPQGDSDGRSRTGQLRQRGPHRAVVGDQLSGNSRARPRSHAAGRRTTDQVAFCQPGSVL
jgi:hypothetical protein